VYVCVNTNPSKEELACLQALLGGEVEKNRGRKGRENLHKIMLLF